MKSIKTKVLVVALALCLVAIASLGTMAWFTDSDSVNNDFFIAGSEDNDPDEIFSVDVWEDKTPDDPDGEAKLDSIRFDDVLPGDDLYKEVNIENTGSYDQYIRATVTVTGASVWQKLFGDTYFPLSSLATDLNADFVVDRTVYNADEDTMTYVLYYKNILPAKQGNVVTLFTNVAIPEAMTREDAAALVEDGKFQINVVADAIQTENVGNSAIEAFTTANMYEEAGEFTLVTTTKGLERVINSGFYADLKDELDFSELLQNPNSEDVTLKLEDDDVIDAGIYNEGGKLDITGGKIETDKAGIENLGNATITDTDIVAGSPADYSNITLNSGVTVYDNVDIVTAGGGIAAANGGKVIFNSGSVYLNSKSTSGRYLFYTEGAGSEIIINGGTFDFDRTQNQKRAYICAVAGSTVTVNGGTFGTASTRSGYTAGILGEGTVIIKGGTFGFDPSAWVADGYEAVKTGSTWTVSIK